MLEHSVCYGQSMTSTGACFTKLGFTKPGYEPKPGLVNPCFYSLVYSVPLKQIEAENGRIWRARIIKPRLQARARIPGKTQDDERRFLERHQSRPVQQSDRKKVPAAESRVLCLSAVAHNLLRGSQGNNLRKGIRAQSIKLGS